VRLVSDDTWAILTVWQEARGEMQAGRVAVAEVIRNRTQRRYQSDGTVAGTVLHPLAFSGWNVHDPNRIPSALLDEGDPVVRQCIEAWTTARTGSDTVHGAVLYCNPALAQPAWAAQAKRVAVIGNHEFFLDP